MLSKIDWISCWSTKQFSIWHFLLIETFPFPTQTNWLKQLKFHNINYSKWRSLLPFCRVLPRLPPSEFLKLTICRQQKKRMKFAREAFWYHVKKFNICPETPSIKLGSGAISSTNSEYCVYSPFCKDFTSKVRHSTKVKFFTLSLQFV